MTSLLKLYFGGLETLASLCETRKSVGDTGPTFSERLGRIFETFLPVVQYSGQILGNVPTIRLPKVGLSASGLINYYYGFKII